MSRLLLCFCLLAGGLTHVGASDGVEAEPEWEATTAGIASLALGGEHEAAMREAEAALGRARAEFGADDPRTAEILTLQAELHMQQGRWEEGERLLLEGMEIRDRVLPPLHWAREESRNLLAGVYAETGRFAEAERSFRWASEQAARAAEAGLVGPQAPRWVDVATPLSLMALTWHRHGKLAELPSIHAEMLAVMEQWGEEAPGLAVDLLDGYASSFAYRDDEANALRAAELMERMAVAADEPAAQAAARFRMGRLTESAEGIEVAAVHYLQAWALATPVLDTDDPLRVEYASYAAEAAVDQGRHDEAEPWLREALRIAEAQPDAVADLDVARCRSLLAGLLERRGLHEEAIPQRERAATLYGEIYGTPSWMLALELTNLADARRGAGQIASARDGYRDAFDVLQRTDRPAGRLDGALLRRWLVVDLRLGDLHGAAERWSALLALRERAGGSKGPRAPQARNELVALHRAAGLEPPAETDASAMPRIELSDRALSGSLLDLLQDAMGEAGDEIDPAAAARFALVAEIAIEDGKAELALEAYELALGIQFKIKGAGDPRTQAMAQRFAVLLREAGREDLASKMLINLGVAIE